MTKEQLVKGTKHSGLLSLVGCLVMTAAATQAQAPATPQGAPAPAAGMRDAAVTVDFGQTRGTLLRTERYNNLTRANRWLPQRDADVQFFNEQGLHGHIYRVWIIVEEIHDFKTGRYNYDGIDDYLADVSRLSDELLVVLDTRESMGKLRRTPEQLRTPVKTILRYIKERHSQVKYIEPFNEPDHNLRDFMKPEQLYAYYRVYNQAVNEVNRELKPKIPLLIGGPATGSCGSPWAPPGPNNMGWIPKFLDAYAADRDPGKRLDFLSYHAYGFFKNQRTCSDYQPIRTDPSILAGQRARTDDELRKRGLDVNIPSFLTETGGYPGPSYDNKQDPRPDYLRQAAIMASYMYWYLENPKDVPFNWVLRHSQEERKDQLVTRARNGQRIETKGADNVEDLPTRTFTPYGNQMLMFSKLKRERVGAWSSALQAGKGVYALATRDDSGAAVMVWNYQQAAAQPFRVAIDMGQLPANLRGKTLRQRMYRIDDKISNYWGNPATANLQQVSDAVVKPGARLNVSVDLTANALQLIVLEPSRS
ncbi:MAG: glycosyl hydrolase [Novosphingobium sp.]|nr:glycosyl hydrolase [Novosphingobium sp.]